MIERRILQVDVFSPEPARGNGLAVVVDAGGLDDAAMQRFAAWTNLAETTFLLPPIDPAADYRVRICTPAREMPFAGHPTLGSCAAWLHTGGRPRSPGRVRQRCGVGIVPVRVEGGGGFAFDASATRVRPMRDDTREAIVAALSIPPSAIARWRHAEGHLTGATLVAQGTTIGRNGRVSVEPDGDAVWIGGQVHVLIAGTLVL